MLEPGWRVVDVGCGDGTLARRVADHHGDLEITGVETRPRPDTAIEVVPFDGDRLPFPDRSVDAVLLVDVLHHTNDPAAVLAEARRIVRHAIVVKDHRLSRPAARPVLRFMDFVGNRHHGVALPYNYWPMARWRRCWDELNLRVDHDQTDLGIPRNEAPR